MSRLVISADVKAPLADVFGYVDDHTNFTKYMKDVTRWEPVGAQNHGKGAQFRVAMRAGPITLDSVVDITDWAQDRVIGWRSVSGLKQDGSWTFTGRGAHCSVALEMEFELPGGIAGKVLARAADPIIRGNLERSVQQLKEQTERIAAAAPVSAGSGHAAVRTTSAKAAPANRAPAPAGARSKVAKPAVAKASVAQPAVAKAKVAQPAVAKATVTHTRRASR